jgi:methionine synthase II (cobalamin-independent)
MAELYHSDVIGSLLRPRYLSRARDSYAGLERLAISTQCGFSSVLIGANLINEDVEERKLELVAEVAHEIW